jgi:UDP-sulfoquinovose synthase
MQCLTLALENPPKIGEYRVFNQFEEVYDVTELALKVQKVGGELGLQVELSNLENPRKELEVHYYKPDRRHLRDLGYRPTHDTENEMRNTLCDLLPFHNRIEAKRETLIPDIRWFGERRKAHLLNDKEMPQIDPQRINVTAR